MAKAIWKNFAESLIYHIFWVCEAGLEKTLEAGRSFRERNLVSEKIFGLLDMSREKSKLLSWWKMFNVWKRENMHFLNKEMGSKKNRGLWHFWRDSYETMKDFYEKVKTMRERIRLGQVDYIYIYRVFFLALYSLNLTLYPQFSSDRKK